MTDKEENELLHEWFTHPGWEIMKERLITIRKNEEDIRRLQTLEQLHYKKGIVEHIDWFIQFPEMVKYVLDELDAKTIN